MNASFPEDYVLIERVQKGDRNAIDTLIRKYEPKPLRVFLQDGSADLNIYGGDWWMANQEMERALKFAGYEVEHVWGTGGHSGQHATQIFPDAMRWLWKEWPAPVKAGLGSPQLCEILIPGEGWKLVADGLKFTEGPAVNSKGEVFFTDIPASKIHKIAADGKVSLFVADSKKANGQAFGPDGHPVTALSGVSLSVEEGEFLVDSVFDEAAAHPEDAALQRLDNLEVPDSFQLQWHGQPDGGLQLQQLLLVERWVLPVLPHQPGSVDLFPDGAAVRFYAGVLANPRVHIQKQLAVPGKIQHSDALALQVRDSVKIAEDGAGTIAILRAGRGKLDEIRVKQFGYFYRVIPDREKRAIAGFLQQAERWRRWDSCFTLGFSFIHGGSIRQRPEDHRLVLRLHTVSSPHASLVLRYTPAQVTTCE